MGDSLSGNPLGHTMFTNDSCRGSFQSFMKMQED